MAFQIISFDGLDLPVYNPTQDHSGASVESALQSAIGSMFDYYGATRKRGKQAQFTISGLVIGEEESYFVDEAGNFFVDELGNFFTTGDQAASFSAKVNALRAKRGTRGQLIRYQMGNNARQWVTARLLDVRQMQDVKDREVKAELTCVFETVMDAWHSETITTSTKTIAATVESLSIYNGGNATVHDAVATMTATSTLTSLRIQNAAAGIDLTWTGTLATGTSLVIDNGLRTIRNNGVDAFSGLVRNAGHTAKGWLPIPVGLNLWTITSSASGSISVGHYDQWL